MRLLNPTDSTGSTGLAEPAGSAGSTGMARAHGIRIATALTAADMAITVVGALVLAWAFPTMSAWTARLILVLALAACVTVLISAARAWQRVGVTDRVRTWGVLALPAAIAALPLVGGVELPGTGQLVILIVGYAATAYFEESLFRGVVLELLRRRGLWPAVMISSALFACAHLPNMLFGQAPGVTLAQAVGTFCFGIGYAALRLRIGGLWPLIALHFVTDLALQLDTLPTGAHWSVMVGGDTLLLVYGLLLIRRSQASSGPSFRAHRGRRLSSSVAFQ